MRKRWWVAIGLAMVLAGAAFGGTVLAHGGTGAGGGAADLLGRVAEKLGISEDEVTSAFNEARAEIQQERLAAAQDQAETRLRTLLDARVDAGDMTREEADAYLAWWLDRPDTSLGSQGFGIGPSFRFGGSDGGFHFRFFRPFHGAPAPSGTDGTTLGTAL